MTATLAQTVLDTELRPRLEAVLKTAEAWRAGLVEGADAVEGMAGLAGTALSWLDEFEKDERGTEWPVSEA